MGGRMRHLAIALVLGSAGALPAAEAAEAAEAGPGMPRVESPAAVLVEVFPWRVLYEKAARQPRYPASTTKVLTALLVLERGDLDAEVGVASKDLMVEAKNLPLAPGGRITRRELLYGLLMYSANNIGCVLARDHSGSVEAFGEAMTRRAAELGAEASCFRNPHGLFDEGHMTSVWDMALIMREAMRHEEFRRIIGTRVHSWPGTGKPVTLATYNRMLKHYPGALGGKTGWIVKSGKTLVSAARRDGRELVAVVFGASGREVWDDTERLMNRGFGAPENTPLVCYGK